MTSSPKNRHPSSRRRIRLVPNRHLPHPINGQQRSALLELLQTTYLHEVRSQPFHSGEGASSQSTTTSSSVPTSSNATPLGSQQRLTNAELREMRRLAALLPVHLQVQCPQTQPALLVNNVGKYISQLTATLVARVQNNSLPKEVLDQLFIGIPSSSNNGRRQMSTNSGNKKLRASRGGQPFWQLQQFGRPSKKNARKLAQKKDHRD